MKSTGVIRRIDELGRVVIPKEIRKNLEIRDGEFLEIYTDDNSVVLKKYSKMDANINLAKKVCKIINETYGYKIMITDRDKIIASEDGLYTELIGSNITDNMKSLIDNRYSYISQNEESITIAKKNVLGYFAMIPIIVSTDCLGLVVVFSGKPIDDTINNILKLTVKLFEYKIDIA
ncbi:MAG: AbrB/MazE/SpoVT family DNA-binding domain-containing protein [Bacilli bacterium]|nr:AbrB/MazE/SpoVT family DNA-binding domain-containing protein [Bacilli bacterium]